MSGSARAAALLLLLLAAGADAMAFRAVVYPFLTQPDAKASCIAQGGTLAKVNKESLASVEALTCLDAAWVGAEDTATEGTWVWQDGSALSKDDDMWLAGPSLLNPPTPSLTPQPSNPTINP